MHCLSSQSWKVGMPCELGILMSQVTSSYSSHLTAGESAGFFGAQISGKLVSMQEALLTVFPSVEWVGSLMGCPAGNWCRQVCILWGWRPGWRPGRCAGRSLRGGCSSAQRTASTFSRHLPIAKLHGSQYEAKALHLAQHLGRQCTSCNMHQLAGNDAASGGPQLVMQHNFCRTQTRQ